jgi:hypothetical protein
MDDLPDVVILEISKFLDYESLQSLKKYKNCHQFIINHNFVFRTSKKMETLLRGIVLKKGEETAMFLPEKGVNMDGSTKKKYKEKEILKKRIIKMRENLFFT